MSVQTEKARISTEIRLCALPTSCIWTTSPLVPPFLKCPYDSIHACLLSAILEGFWLMLGMQCMRSVGLSWTGTHCSWLQVTIYSCALHQVAEHEAAGDPKQIIKEPEQSKADLSLTQTVLRFALQVAPNDERAVSEQAAHFLHQDALHHCCQLEVCCWLMLLCCHKSMR